VKARKELQTVSRDQNLVNVGVLTGGYRGKYGTGAGEKGGKMQGVRDITKTIQYKRECTARWKTARPSIPLAFRWSDLRGRKRDIKKGGPLRVKIWSDLRDNGADIAISGTLRRTAREGVEREGRARGLGYSTKTHLQLAGS